MTVERLRGLLLRALNETAFRTERENFQLDEAVSAFVHQGTITDEQEAFVRQLLVEKGTR